MPCYAPLQAFRSKDVGASGKRGITFNRNAAFSGVPMYVPCGQCVGCKLERSRQWAMRIVHEAQLYNANVFLTLTYDDKHLPLGNTLVKRDIQLFHKRLHNRLLRERGRGIRFYYCGEYGEATRRPHYHSIIFDYGFPDKKFHSRAKRGEDLFTSQYVRDLWPMGHNVIGAVSFDTAAYVARYCVKKISGPDAADHYITVDDDGVIHERVPEFTNMSRRPGIGFNWFKKYGEHSYQWDKIIVNGKEVNPPRYYDTKYEQVDSAHLDKLKKKRSRMTPVRRAESKIDRLRVRETVALAKLNLNKRKL